MRRSAIALAALLWLGYGWAGELPQQRLTWEDLGAKITNKKIGLVLPDGTHVEGKVIGVERDGLRLHISKSSNRARQPKGAHLIPRASVSVLRVEEYRTIGRVLGAMGAAAVAGGIAGAKYPDVYEGPTVVIVPVVVAGGIIGSAVGGYYFGKVLDRKVTELSIVADDKSGSAAR